MTFVSLVVLASISAAQKPSVALEDISGMYSFQREGEFVQITVEPGEAGKPAQVTGFVSRLSGEPAKVTDHFFRTASLDKEQISFTTRPVHSVWFEFRGNVSRGKAKTRTEDGYFLIQGTLKTYAMDAAGKSTVQSREITMKSFSVPEDDTP